MSEENHDHGQEQEGQSDARMQKQSRPNDQQENKGNCLDCLKKLSAWLISPITWVYRLQPIEKFTAILCVIGTVQVWTFIASERPFVSVSQIQIAGGELKAEVPLVFIIGVKNSGKETAFVVDSRNIVRTQPDLPLYRGLKRDMVETTAKGPIVAGDTNSIISRPTNKNGQPIVLAQKQIDQLAIGDQHLWIIGYITYKDLFPIFGATNTTGYCFVYNPKPADGRLGNFDRCGDEEYEYAH
jgi:hypothetical protein